MTSGFLGGRGGGTGIVPALIFSAISLAFILSLIALTLASLSYTESLTLEPNDPVLGFGFSFCFKNAAELALG